MSASTGLLSLGVEPTMQLSKESRLGPHLTLALTRAQRDIRLPISTQTQKMVLDSTHRKVRVAWLYKIHGNDVPYSPIVHAFAIITPASPFFLLIKESCNPRAFMKNSLSTPRSRGNWGHTWRRACQRWIQTPLKNCGIRLLLTKPWPEIHIKASQLFYWILLLLGSAGMLVAFPAFSLLSSLYFSNGGTSKWISSWVAVAGWPIRVAFLIPIYVFPGSSLTRLTFKLTISYVGLGFLSAADNLMYAYPYACLSASTASLVASTSLVFFALFGNFSL